MNLHRRPLFPIAVAYAAGIILAAEMGLALVTSLSLGVVSLLLGALMPIGRMSRSVTAVVGLMCLVGLLRTSYEGIVPPGDISRYAEGKLVHLTGVIASDPEPRADGRIRFVLRVESVKTYTGEYAVSGRTMVSIYKPRWEDDVSTGYVPFHGDRVRIHGKLRVPSSPANPGIGSYADYLSRRRIHCIISTAAQDVVRLGPGSGAVSRATASLKALLTGKVLKLFPGEKGGLVLGILLGNYAALSLGAQSAFMRTGTMHLLAASGYNCGVLVLIFRWMLQRATVPRAWTHVFLIVLLWVFAALAGAGPSIVRATIMMTVFLSSYLLWRAPDLINTVLFSGLLILVANPLSLYDVGFQLSFAAVLAIVLAMPVIEAHLCREKKQRKRPAWQYGIPWRAAVWSWRNITGAVLLSIAAAVGTMPITAFYFNYLSVVSVLANAMVALLVVALTVFGLAAIAFSAVPLLGPAAAACGGIVSGWMLSIVESLSRLSWASYSVRSPTWIFILCYYVVVLAMLEHAYRSISPVRKTPSNESEKKASE